MNKPSQFKILSVFIFMKRKYEREKWIGKQNRNKFLTKLRRRQAYYSDVYVILFCVAIMIYNLFSSWLLPPIKRIYKYNFLGIQEKNAFPKRSNSLYFTYLQFSIQFFLLFLFLLLLFLLLFLWCCCLFPSTRKKKTRRNIMFKRCMEQVVFFFKNIFTVHENMLATKKKTG